MRFIPTFRILNSNCRRIVSVTSVSIPSRSVPQDAQADANPTALFQPTVLRHRQKQYRVHRDPERIDCEDPGYTYFDPVLNNYEPAPMDLLSKEGPVGDCLKNISSKDVSPCLTTVSIEPLPPSRPLLIPTSARSLYHNLIHTLRTRKPRPTLPALLDYHRLFPKYHSTKSYNLLIFLSIRHRSFGIAQSLFGAMRHHSIRDNIETYQLHVRWFIYQGFWDKAWSYVMQLMNKFPGGTIPFPIWLEFCHTRKGRTITRKDTLNPDRKSVV